MTKNKKLKPAIPMEKPPKVDIFDNPKINYLMIAIIIIVICVLYYPLAFKGYIPEAHDTQQWRWASQQILEFNAENSTPALWTDNMSAGMPTYLLTFPSVIPSPHRLLILLDSIVSWHITFMLFGGIGMYFLMKYLKFSPLIALFASFAFTLSCHYIGILDIGHNTKFRAAVYLPWILMTFEYLRKTRKLLPVGLLALLLFDQLRVNHFQVSYYTYLMLIIYWIVYLVKSIRDKTLSDYFKFSGLALGALAIAILAVANPYLSTFEYSQFTIRAAGSYVDRGMATMWSFGIMEWLTFFVPNFFGGVIQSGPYWGGMPFTQTFMYMGIMVFYLAIIASIYYFKQTKIKALVIISLVSLLISFGKYIPFLSDFLLNYLPLFNKFRVPAMILLILQFCIPVLAAFGVKLIIDKAINKDKIFEKTMLVSLISSVVLFILFMFGENLFREIISLSRPDDLLWANRFRMTVPQLHQWRLDVLIESGMRSFAILIGCLTITLLFIKGILKNKNVFLILLIAITILDLQLVNREHFQENNMTHRSSILEEFQTTPADAFLNQDTSLFRIFPANVSRDRDGNWIRDNLYNDARWSFYHQSIGGYHGAALKRFRDIEDTALNFPINHRIPLNWNILNMLNVKYLIFNFHRQWDDMGDHLEWVAQEVAHETGVFIYKNHDVLPRAWFVRDTIYETNWNRVVNILNNPGFNPRYTALIEHDIPPFQYSEDNTIEMLERCIHYTIWKTNTSSDALMVISEIYFPAGWKVFVNGVQTPIFPVNHILRGIIIPEGETLVEMRFKPSSFTISVILSAIGILLAIAITLIGLILFYRENYGNGMVYKIKM